MSKPFLFEISDILKHIEDADRLVQTLKYPADVHVKLAQVKIDFNRLIMEAEELVDRKEK